MIPVKQQNGVTCSSSNPQLCDVLEYFKKPKGKTYQASIQTMIINLNVVKKKNLTPDFS